MKKFCKLKINDAEKFRKNSFPVPAATSHIPLSSDLMFAFLMKTPRSPLMCLTPESFKMFHYLLPSLQLQVYLVKFRNIIWLSGSVANSKNIYLVYARLDH